MHVEEGGGSVGFLLTVKGTIEVGGNGREVGGREERRVSAGEDASERERTTSEAWARARERKVSGRVRTLCKSISSFNSLSLLFLLRISSASASSIGWFLAEISARFLLPETSSRSRSCRCSVSNQHQYISERGRRSMKESARGEQREREGELERAKGGEERERRTSAGVSVQSD